MNLKEALIFTETKLASGEKSDGCTMAPDMGIHKFCVMHDMLRRFNPVSGLQARNLLFQGIMTKGVHYLPVAIIYWIYTLIDCYVGIGGAIGITFLITFITWAYLRG